MRHLGNHSFDEIGIARRGADCRLGEWRKLVRIGVVARYLNARWLYYAFFDFAGEEQVAMQIPSDWRGRPRVTALVGLLQEAQRRAPPTVEIMSRARLVLEWGERSDFTVAQYRATGVNDVDTHKLLDAARWRWVWLQHWQAARLARAATRYAPSELEPVKTLLLIEAERGARATRVLALCEAVLARSPGDKEAQQVRSEAMAWQNRPLWKKVLGWLPVAIPLTVAAAGLAVLVWANWEDERRGERRLKEAKRVGQRRQEEVTMLETWARGGDVKAMRGLAQAHERGELGLKADPAEAHTWRLRAAEAGEVPAMLEVGRALLRGKDTAKDIAAAQTWLEKAADDRSGTAADMLGDLFYAGSEVPQDYAAAYRWYLRAVELGYKGARGRLAFLHERGWGTERDFAAAFALYRVLADEGDAWAANKVGYLLATGQGVERDVAGAARWYRKGAEKGNATAQMNLAYALRHGRGVARDPAEAVTWLEKAAAQGNDGAAVFQAEMLWRGEGVKRDRAEAAARMERLANKDVPSARTMLGKFLVASGPQEDPVRARALFAAGAAAGSSADRTFHGLLCLEGIGGPRDVAAALANLELAANAGQESAALFLAGARMGYRQPGVAPDLAGAREAMKLVKHPDKESAPYLRCLEEGGDLAALFVGKPMADTAMLPDDTTSQEGALPWERLPEPVYQVPPIYPIAMRVLGIEGEVFVDFYITPTGRVEKARALRSTQTAFDDAAVSVVQQWRFKPGVKAGRARSTHIQVPIVFALNEEADSTRVELEVEQSSPVKP